jgi:hypothetical protein
MPAHASQDIEGWKSVQHCYHWHKRRQQWKAWSSSLKETVVNDDDDTAIDAAKAATAASAAAGA